MLLLIADGFFGVGEASSPGLEFDSQLYASHAQRAGALHASTNSSHAFDQVKYVHRHDDEGVMCQLYKAGLEAQDLFKCSGLLHSSVEPSFDDGCQLQRDLSCFTDHFPVASIKVLIFSFSGVSTSMFSYPGLERIQARST